MSRAPGEEMEGLESAIDGVCTMVFVRRTAGAERPGRGFVLFSFHAKGYRKENSPQLLFSSWRVPLLWYWECTPRRSR